MAPHRFLRITMKSHYECAYSQAGGRFLSTQSDGGVAACDFPMEHVEKAAYWKVFKPSGSPLPFRRQICRRGRAAAGPTRAGGRLQRQFVRRRRRE